VTRSSAAIVAAIAFGPMLGCGESGLPRHGETVISVDLDMPVPKVVSRLRVDVFDEQGRWLESRDISRPHAADWPTSFSVYSESESDPARVFVRLRAYGAGRVRDYLGERFWDWSAGAVLPVAATPDHAPRLIQDGRDVTPANEPEPLITVDRLVLAPIEPGELQQIDVVLHASCAGTMSFLSATAGHGPTVGVAQTCVDSEKSRVLVEPAPTTTRHAAEASRQATHERDCGLPLDPTSVCIPGGVTILGSVELSLVPDRPATPERIAVHAPFFLDRDEVTVARYRQALAAGFSPPTPPTENEGPFGVTLATSCTFSAADVGRESYPLNCVDWFTAEAFCAFAGGTLPSEAQWEHAATIADPRGRSRYPWGNETPTCEHAVYGRQPLANSPGVCEGLGTQPEPVEASASDVTPQGVVGIAGSMSEWQRDHYRGYDEPCWVASPIADPFCADEGTTTRSVRGASWVAPPTILPSAVRLGGGDEGQASFIGFRCVYPESP
jgi:formylglycine-generating enzyme required for sulfatase activity